MQNQPPKTQTTNSGIANNSLKGQILENNSPTKLTHEEKNGFLSAVAEALGEGFEACDGMPSIEAPRHVVEHYVGKQHMESVDRVGYFVFQNVKVFVEGEKAAAVKRDKMTIEEKLFGRK